MKLLALSIGGGTNGGPGYDLNNNTLPSDIRNLLANLNISGGNGLQHIVTFALNLLLTSAALLSFFFILFGGIRWIMSQGDKKQLETAQKTIQYAIIGLIVALLSFFIVNLIAFALGVGNFSIK